ncbi:EF-hand calcium-binding domain-containing protein 4B-like isoform X2 [Tubulanus polymorphus]|uniref:EF-hand calcium-binding domain-containing protein 4B-like isoform X2 n=1 Tax=Tubulanus polymorphus TaxID=672921 RepID=UPI003DA48349
MATYTEQGLASDEPGAPLDIEAMMVQKAHELFAICDAENKGFITKRDMQRLQNELPLNPDQLESVFDSLDDDGNGYLTLEEFTDGFGVFLGMNKPEEEKVNANNEVYETEHPFSAELSGDEDEVFNETMENMGAMGMFDDQETLKHLWGRLRKEDPNLLSGFEEFLSKITNEVKKTQSDYQTIESALKSKANAHDEEVRKLYEEMENQIKTEREKILNEEKQREREIRSDLEKDLYEKDKQLQELLRRHTEMEDRLNQLNSMEAETKLENDRLFKEKLELEDMLANSQDSLEESRTYIKQLSDQQKIEKKERARAAMNISENIAVERESLVRQLEMLRDVNKKLRDEKDENWAKWVKTDRNDSTQAMGERAPHLSVDDGKEGGVPSSPGAPTTATAPASSEPKKNTLVKQGSILSNYFSPRMSTGSNVDGIDEDIECDDDAFIAQNMQMDSLHHAPNPDRLEAAQRRGKMKRYQSMDSNWRANNLSDDSDSADESRLGGRTDRKYRSMRVKRSEFDLPDGMGKDEMAQNMTRQQPVGANSHPETHETQKSLPSISEEEPLPTTPERVFKVVFIGDSGVGKSSFIHRFCTNEFKATFSATIGVDFQVKALIVDRHMVALQLWDTAGQERFRSITKQYFRKADGVLLMYDVTSESSFTNVRNWILSVQEGVEYGTVLVLVGNKLDLLEDEENRSVKERDGQKLAEEYDALFYETSAKSGINVQESIEAMARKLREREDREMEKALTLQEPPESLKKKGCCS